MADEIVKVEEQETKEQPVEKVETKVEETETEDKPNSKGYIKYRVERAKEDAVNTLLAELGVDTVEDAKEKIQSGEKALTLATELATKIKDAEEKQLSEMKTIKLKQLLENEKVFDSDALVRYIDINKVDLDNEGNVVDSEGIVNALKKAKPNFFGSQYLKSDNHVKGTEPTEQNYKSLYDKGDYLGVLTQYVNKLNKK